MGLMKRNIEKIKTGWYIPVPLKEQFVTFCADMGNLAQEDCAGALLIWQYLPAQIRESARLEAKGIRAVDKRFWKHFRAGLELGIQAQLDSLQQKPDKNG